MLDRLGLYARTLKHLRPRQWVYQPVRRFQRRRPAGTEVSVHLDIERVAALSHAAAELRSWPPDHHLQRAEEVAGGCFTFLNHSETLRGIDWCVPHVSPLWTYHLHYFDCARDLAWAYRATQDPRFVSAFERLATEWMTATAGRDSPGWEAYPTAVRTLNWMHALLLLYRQLSNAFIDRLARSIHFQLTHLERRLEWHLLGNHLLRDFAALHTGGLLFTGVRAERWRNGPLWTETLRQIAPDGLHEERTPSYHALALVDSLSVMHLSTAAGCAVPSAVGSALQAMTGALGRVTRKDGTPYLLHDSAIGVAPGAREINDTARRTLGFETVRFAGTWTLAQSGYAGYADPDRVSIVIDCGEPAPPHQPGHSHCSVFSYELDVRGRPVIVDSGVHGYDGDTFREYVRSTRAHNTVMVAGREQSEMWGTFRVGGRAAVRSSSTRSQGGGFEFAGEYSPHYDRDVIHRRCLVGCAWEWSVTDTVSGADGALVESFVHLHPTFSVTIDGGTIVASDGRALLVFEPFNASLRTVIRGERSPDQGWYCPEFGKAEPQHVLVFRALAGAAPFGYRIRVAVQDVATVASTSASGRYL